MVNFRSSLSSVDLQVTLDSLGFRKVFVLELGTFTFLNIYAHYMGILSCSNNNNQIINDPSQ